MGAIKGFVGNISCRWCKWACAAVDLLRARLRLTVERVQNGRASHIAISSQRWGKLFRQHLVLLVPLHDRLSEFPERAQSLASKLSSVGACPLSSPSRWVHLNTAIDVFFLEIVPLESRRHRLQLLDPLLELHLLGEDTLTDDPRLVKLAFLGIEEALKMRSKFSWGGGGNVRVLAGNGGTESLG